MKIKPTRIFAVCLVLIVLLYSPPCVFAIKGVPERCYSAPVAPDEDFVDKKFRDLAQALSHRVQPNGLLSLEAFCELETLLPHEVCDKIEEAFLYIAPEDAGAMMSYLERIICQTVKCDSHDAVSVKIYALLYHTTIDDMRTRMIIEEFRMLI